MCQTRNVPRGAGWKCVETPSIRYVVSRFSSHGVDLATEETRPLFAQHARWDCPTRKHWEAARFATGEKSRSRSKRIVRLVTTGS
jgi:hypothetical protein